MEHRWNEIDRGKLKYSEKKPVPVPLCPQQIPNGPTQILFNNLYFTKQLISYCTWFVYNHRFHYCLNVEYILYLILSVNSQAVIVYLLQSSRGDRVTTDVLSSTRIAGSSQSWAHVVLAWEHKSYCCWASHHSVLVPSRSSVFVPRFRGVSPATNNLVRLSISRIFDVHYVFGIPSTLLVS
jgi:hypothetical protein